LGMSLARRTSTFERAARVITSEVLKLSPCSIVRGSTDIITASVDYNFDLSSSATASMNSSVLR
jgi:hypothetical protein